MGPTDTDAVTAVTSSRQVALPRRRRPARDKAAFAATRELVVLAFSTPVGELMPYLTRLTALEH